MLIVFQIIFSLVALFAIGSVLKKNKLQHIGIPIGMVWSIFWIIATIAVWWPNATQYLASAVGIGRGVDLIIYISVVVLFYFVFKLYLKTELLNRHLTVLVRKQALKKSLNSKDKK